MKGRKSNSTKRALISSVLAFTLCVAMLIGTTFAWFTDSASTAVNKIQAGNLGLALDMKEGNNWVTAEGKTLDFKKAVGAENEEILWEPGCTYELPELRVTNNGNLALKYKVRITGIKGSEKLNEVIDWTIDGATLGEEYHLRAGESQNITIKGHMQETAGNEYQNEFIDGVSITVIAVQDTVESDSYGTTYDAQADGGDAFDWYQDISATKDVVEGTDTVIKDRETNPTVTATVPANSTNATKLTLIKTAADKPADITVKDGAKTITADIKLVDQDGNTVNAADGKFFTLTMQLDKNMVVKNFYHYGTELKKVTRAAAVSSANDQYYYDAATGVLTFTTDDFSPFTVKIAYDGGNGKKASPYLIANAEQALAMENGKGYFKLVNDVVVTDEIYLGGKTCVLDLNGHFIRLEYADGVKPNNGSVLYIGGKGGKLTINDSSASQTGAVYGSNKTYTNKVTSAVRAGNYGKLTINGGHFYGTSEGTSCIFVYTSMSSGSKATVVINGGSFETATPSGNTYYVLNHQDNATGGCTITVNGGRFKNYNPGVTVVDPVNEKTGKISLGTDCKTTEEVDGSDTWYIVTK